MRLIVAGGRKYTNWEFVEATLDSIQAHLIRGMYITHPTVKKIPFDSINEIVCGMCDQGIQTFRKDLPQGKAIRVFGADGLGYRWAVKNKIPIAEFPADWRSFRSRAGPLRNGKMADYADALIAFPGTAGTNDMVDKAQKMNLIIFDRRNV